MVCQEILCVRSGELRNPAIAVEIRVRAAVRQYLHQASVEINRVRRGDTARHCAETVHSVIGVRVYAVVDEIAVGVPGIRHAAGVREPVGVVVGVARRPGLGLLRQPVADRIARRFKLDSVYFRQICVPGPLNPCSKRVRVRVLGWVGSRMGVTVNQVTGGARWNARKSNSAGGS